MAYSETVLLRAKARLAQEKADCEAESAARIENIYRQHPRLREIDRAMRRSDTRATSDEQSIPMKSPSSLTYVEPLPASPRSNLLFLLFILLKPFIN